MAGRGTALTGPLSSAAPQGVDRVARPKLSVLLALATKLKVFVTSKCKKPNLERLGFSVFWLPDLDSNQGPAD